MKILALAASSSSTSINKQLATYAAGLVAGAEVEVLDINDYEMPIFSEDKEKEIGQPEQAKRFFQKIGEADAVIISYAEHNGSYATAFKNVFDWTSRIDMKVYQGKPVVMLATSPGPGGAATVLAAATGSAPYFAADVKGSLSVPSFYDNFDMEKGELRNEALIAELKTIMSVL
ncbi:NADPH-dependent FMN reductase [Aliivibrio fischeri]|uniref:NADPH-dependent FMN reductase n=1 Tax=Aliivibrio fischeri TaxID=668 RepID=UPI0012D865AA|nr:NAD(P)H-dependent oxidoreductase [Aliivibrio fischeri]MUK61930.1 NADPH-dependent FMN reductase [Aliivibrio fischeri]MUL21799.1 NADPH-dependent FMN reductase [Aliivibrio fischeri]MUL25986.1 NADPH-dependent FMN reductase [Aliivibrio fischeri]